MNISTVKSSNEDQSMRIRTLTTAIWTTALWLPVVVAAVTSMSQRLSAADAPLEFNRDIRPILAENCFACHGPDSAARKGDLRLDKRDTAIEKKAITPGELSQSEFVRRIESHD